MNSQTFTPAYLSPLAGLVGYAYNYNYIKFPANFMPKEQEPASLETTLGLRRVKTRPN